jgi:hypothetical protein
MRMRSQTECTPCLQVGLWVHGLHSRAASIGSVRAKRQTQAALLPRNAGMPKTHPPRRGKSNFITTVLGGLAALLLLVSFNWMLQSDLDLKESYHHQSDLDLKESYHNRTHSTLPDRTSSQLKPAAEEIKQLPKLQPVPPPPRTQPPPPPTPPPQPPFSQFPITLEDLARLQRTWEASERSKPRCLSF